MKLDIFFFFKKVITDLFFILKNIKYFHYFLKFSLFNYGVLNRISSLFIRFIYIYIIGFFYYIIYTCFYKVIEFFIFTNTLNKIKSNIYFIFDEVLDLNIYHSRKEKKMLYAKISENIGSFYHSHFKIFNRSFKALKRSRITPSQFDAEEFHIIENVYSDHYFYIYMHDLFYSLYITSISNFLRVNYALMINIKFKIKMNLIILLNKKASILFIGYLINAINLIYKLNFIILSSRFKYTSLAQIPRERLILMSFSEGFQGNFFYRYSNIIKEKKTKLFLYPAIHKLLAPSKYKYFSFMSNYQFNLFQTYNYNNLYHSHSNPYSFNKIQFELKEPNYYLFTEFRKLNHRVPNTNRLLLHSHSDFFILKDKFKFFFKSKKIFKFIYFIFGLFILKFILNTAKLYKYDSKWQTIFKIQDFVDSGGWGSFFILLIISVELIAFFMNYII